MLIDTIPATNGPLEFGRLAIMESMAYMIEKKVTIGSPSAPDYPYRSASLVADKIYPVHFGRLFFNGADRESPTAKCSGVYGTGACGLSAALSGIKTLFET